MSETRARICATAGMAVLTLCGFLAGADKVPGVETRPLRGIAVSSLDNIDLLRKLDKRVDFDFVGTPLRNVMDYLRQVTQINIVIERDVPVTTPFVTLTHEKVRLRSALNLMLAPDLGYARKDGALVIVPNLGYAIKDGALVIATPERVVQMVNESQQLTPLSGPDALAIVSSLDKSISLSFAKTPLKDALNFIGASVGRRVVVHAPSAAMEAITLDLKNIPAEYALNHLLAPGLDYAIRDGAIWVSTRKRVAAFRGRASVWIVQGRSSSKAASKLRQALRKPVALRFEKTPLGDVMAFLRDSTHANIVFRPEVVAGREVSLTVRKTPLHKALQRLLPADMGYVIDGGVLRIDTREKLQVWRQAWLIVETPEDISLAQGLQKDVEFSFEGTPLTDAVDFLCQLTEQNIVDPGDERLITMALSPTPLGSALRQIIGPDLEYVIRDGAIFIRKRLPYAVR